VESIFNEISFRKARKAAIAHQAQIRHHGCGQAEARTFEAQHLKRAAPDGA
jgi:hypothetical protein